METLALEEPLRFPVPPTASGFDAGVTDYWWGLVEYATDVVDPTTFPAMGASFEPAQRKVLERFIQTTRHLAESAALNHPISLQVRLGDAGSADEITSNDPPYDAVAGFSVLLRQCYAQDENASFKKVMDILWQATVRVGGAGEAERRDQLARWQKAVSDTQTRSVQNRAIKELIRRGVIGDDPNLARYPDSDEPQRLLSDYFYGDAIHWDKKAGVLEQRGQDPLTDAFYRHDFFNAAANFAHLYIGFAALVEAALEEA
jgi:hypothetical protein